MNKPILLAIALFMTGLTGCATSREVRQPDGWLTHVVSCGGPVLNIGHCMEKAGAICGGKGFQVIDNAANVLPEKPSAMLSGGGPDMNVPVSALWEPYQPRKLLIRCN